MEMGEFLILIACVLAILYLLYLLVDRVCLCLERRAVAKAWGQIKQNPTETVNPKELNEFIKTLTKEMLYVKSGDKEKQA